MARKTHKERPKKVEDVEDISADSEPEPDQEVDAPEVKKVTAEKKADTEADDEATTNSEEDQPEKEVKKKEKVSESDSAEKKKRKRKVEALHPPTIDMVLDALVYLDNKKGVTIPAMKDYIMTQNTVRPESLKHLLRKALSKLLEKEKIVRPKGEENKSVLLGRYKIAPKVDVKPEPPRERPASLRKLGGGGGKVKKTKKKKRKRSSY